jgi:branched-chain amino acid transport system permease protein
VSQGRAQLVTGLALVALLVLLLFGTSLLENDYYVRIIELIGINMILAVGLNVSSGFTGVFSLGQIGFMAIGAYASALLTLPPGLKNPALLPDLPPVIATLDLTHLPAPVALLIGGMAGGLLAALVAALVGIPLMRLSGHYVAVATMGFLVIVNAVLVNLEGVTKGARPLGGIPRYTNVWLVYAVVAIAVYVAWRLLRSPYGRAMLAQRENLVAAQGMGVDILRTRLLAFVIGAFFSALAGALWAHLLTALSPTAFYFTYTFQIIIMVIVGGMGSVTGAVIGAFLLTLIPELLRGVEGGLDLGFVQLPPLFGLSQIILAVAFVLVMIFRRQGLMGDRELPLFVPRGSVALARGRAATVSDAAASDVSNPTRSPTG